MTLYCKSVESLPSFISLESLKSLTLSACSSLKKFPDIEGNMESLLELNLDGTAIEDLPPSFGLLTGRSCLNLGDCKNLLCLPSSIKYLTSLKNLILVRVFCILSEEEIAESKSREQGSMEQCIAISYSVL
ncbi:hypothetical protein L3X38_043478 [Prunus dulcis]|uniref:Disease resistance protein RPS4B/Roq1-like leucine-rich repeats domain-containing protein n=1 Tax=Prunus dulcis TaxID=3755 RepID=A0AAD4YLA5_PRUDU|nr:hypothetical protein L3X38_043478 [Prunus dulcis]